ncbi:predicted protein [Naegleria gruberi]|uniref:Predicted protein n=1 Tax=Naegleria gruberi TaxID=5762 RepID=D2VH18_NAEGR|nr:uncharacterized protein NAEGRDRAFT_58208 [Naegleria gruberi]EFC43907.1 predicted protein [Naegleria gruberi]|eukprot:XP_002676651.1 predicted protein [Naegleria gruberi strain NEG-M]
MHSNIHTNHSQGVDHKGVANRRDDKSNSSESNDSSPHTNTDHNGIKKKKSKKVACVACHKAHARCDRSCGEQRSCSRCIKNGIQCVEQIKRKTTREERLKTLQEQRKNSLNMKILPRTCNSNTNTNQSTCSSSTSTSPHTRISPSTPSQLYSGNNPFNNVSSPSISSACSQSSTSSTNSEMSHNSTSSNSSQSTVNSGYLMFQQVKSPGLNNSQLISFGQTIPSSQISFQNCSPQTTFTKVSGENNSSTQPNPSFHNPFMQQIVAMRNTSPYIPLNAVAPFNSHNSGNKFPTQSTPFGLSFNSPEFQPVLPPQPSFFTTPVVHQNVYPNIHSIGLHENRHQTPPPSSSVNNNDNNYLEADNQSTYTSRIFPSSSRSAQISEMLDSYSLPNPDDLEQLFSSLENARNV